LDESQNQREDKQDAQCYTPIVIDCLIGEIPNEVKKHPSSCNLIDSVFVAGTPKVPPKPPQVSLLTTESFYESRRIECLVPAINFLAILP
jgi:hypothetical protein